MKAKQEIRDAREPWNQVSPKHLLPCPESLGVKPVDEEIHLVLWQDTRKVLRWRTRKDSKTLVQGLKSS